MFVVGVVCQIRLPPEVSDDVDDDPTGNKALWDRGVLNGASQKVSWWTLSYFSLGCMVTVVVCMLADRLFCGQFRSALQSLYSNVLCAECFYFQFFVLLFRLCYITCL